MFSAFDMYSDLSQLPFKGDVAMYKVKFTVHFETLILQHCLLAGFLYANAMIDS